MKEEWRKRYEVKDVPLLEHCSLGEEELAELDLGPAQDLFNDEIIEIDNKGEMPGLDFLLNCDIRMFCSPLISEFISTADWQLCCAEQLTQLDISYCDLLPDLYKNLPQVIEVEASCSSGSGLKYCAMLHSLCKILDRLPHHAPHQDRINKPSKRFPRTYMPSTSQSPC